MSIRTRLTLWYAGMLLGSLLLMGGVLHYELITERERKTGEAPTEQIADVLLFYGVPTVVVLVLGGSWLMRRALRPIEAFTTTAERVHADNLTERIPRSGRGDELDRLAEVFNEMLARVEGGIASVRDFTLHASHELKTPLTILSMQAEGALAEAALAPAQRELLESQLEEVRRLASLVDALALLAKADAGLRVILPQPLALDQELRAACDNIAPLAGSRGISIDFPACEPISVDGDRARLRQALLNLLDNAIRYNHRGGRVSVKLAREDGQATITIANTGPEVPSDLLPRIFERFVRADDGGLHADGSGLGLSVVKAIVVAHGGSIFAQSAPGETRFQVGLRMPVSDSANDSL